ncbi:MAG: helix-turn-helix domain-containing protein [Magnetococcales bacterium]|nr:helix-turn-helix domain-containing protein [Magnetococcales bacterium]
MLEKADRCTEPGEIGSLLRLEGLYSSHLSQWIRQREDGALAGLSPQKRGPRKPPITPWHGALKPNNER